MNIRRGLWCGERSGQEGEVKLLKEAVVCGCGGHTRTQALASLPVGELHLSSGMADGISIPEAPEYQVPGLRLLRAASKETCR